MCRMWLNFKMGVLCRPCAHLISFIVCVKAPIHVAPKRGGTLRGNPEPPQRGGGEGGDGDAEAGSGVASGAQHAPHWSR